MWICTAVGATSTGKLMERTHSLLVKRAAASKTNLTFIITQKNLRGGHILTPVSILLQVTSAQKIFFKFGTICDK
jgi:hypothetical protein